MSPHHVDVNCHHVIAAVLRESESDINDIVILQS